MASGSRQEPYEIVAPLGGGGMSLVFLARGKKGETVVLKRLRPELAGDARVAAAFMREARITAKVRHDNVVRVLDTAADYIVLEHVAGTDVATLLEVLYERDTQLPLPVVASIFHDFCAGLSAAHALGVMHRDITAGNILVGWDGRAKLTDFGIAKATAGDQKLTRTGTTKGTLAYMAPEQILGAPTDQRVDIYAASVVLYELITRFNPFLADNDFETMSRIIEVPVPPIAELRPEVPAFLDAVCANGLFRDPERRFDSVDALRAAAKQLKGKREDVAKFLAPLRKPIEAFAAAARDEDEAVVITTAPSIALPTPKKTALPSRDPLQQTMLKIELPPELKKQR